VDFFSSIIHNQPWGGKGAYREEKREGGAGEKVRRIIPPGIFF